MFRTLVSAAAILLLGASLALAAPVTLKLGHIAEPENPYGQGADHFAKLVKERSNGEVEIKVYPSSQLGNQRDLVEGDLRHRGHDPHGHGRAGQLCARSVGF